MENGKIQNSEFKDRQVEFKSNKPILGFLNKKLALKSPYSKTSFASTDQTLESSTSGSVVAAPALTFQISTYQVKEAVEYQVILKQSMWVNRRKIDKVYKFKTRYSKLLKLHQRLQCDVVFPPKKFFGNLQPKFLEQRRIQLQQYLNEVAGQSNKTFEQFISQIKAVNDAELNREFNL